MPAKLTANDTRVSSLFQFMRPTSNNLVLTNAVVSGNLQVKGSASIPSYQYGVETIDATYSLYEYLTASQANKIVYLDLSLNGLEAIDEVDPSGLILLPSANTDMIGKKYKLVFRTDLSGKTSDPSDIQIQTQSEDKLAAGSHVILNNFYGDASQSNGSKVASTNVDVNVFKFTTQSGGNTAYGAGTNFTIECITKNKWLMQGEAHRGRSYVLNETGDASCGGVFAN